MMLSGPVLDREIAPTTTGRTAKLPPTCCLFAQQASRLRLRPLAESFERPPTRRREAAPATLVCLDRPVVPLRSCPAPTARHPSLTVRRRRSNSATVLSPGNCVRAGPLSTNKSKLGAHPLSARTEPIMATTPTNARPLRVSFQRPFAAVGANPCSHHIRKSSASTDCRSSSTGVVSLSSPCVPFDGRNGPTLNGRVDSQRVLPGPGMFVPGRSNSSGSTCGAGRNPETPI